jgi:hypothetical protein
MTDTSPSTTRKKQLKEDGLKFQTWIEVQLARVNRHGQDHDSTTTPLKRGKKASFGKSVDTDEALVEPKPKERLKLAQSTFPDSSELRKSPDSQ